MGYICLLYGKHHQPHYNNTTPSGPDPADVGSPYPDADSSSDAPAGPHNSSPVPTAPSNKATLLGTFPPTQPRQQHTRPQSLHSSASSRLLRSAREAPQQQRLRAAAVGPSLTTLHQMQKNATSSEQRWQLRKATISGSRISEQLWRI